MLILMGRGEGGVVEEIREVVGEGEGGKGVLVEFVSVDLGDLRSVKGAVGEVEGILSGKGEGEEGEGRGIDVMVMNAGIVSTFLLSHFFPQDSGVMLIGYRWAAPHPSLPKASKSPLEPTTSATHICSNCYSPFSNLTAPTHRA